MELPVAPYVDRVGLALEIDLRLTGRHDESDDTIVLALARAFAGQGVKINFTADSTLITIGTCTKLRWHVENWSQITLYLESSSQRVGGDGTQQVCPAYPTTYRLSVTDLSGGVHDRTVTINTKAPPPGLITPVPMPLTSQ